MDLTIGVAARRVGVSIETIRYYEREGVLPSPSKNPGGRRIFRSQDLDVLRFIRRARELGFSLRDTRTLLSYRNGGTCHDVKKLAAKHLEELRDRLRHLHEMEALLAKAIGDCTDDVTTECSVLKALEGKCC